MLVFEERGNPRNKERTNNKLEPHITPGPGIEPRPHWREGSALAAAPPLQGTGSNHMEASFKPLYFDVLIRLCI